MVKKSEINSLLETKRALVKRMEEAVRSILKDNNAVDKTNAIEFDEEVGFPVFYSSYMGMDVMVKRLWLGGENEGLIADYLVYDEDKGRCVEYDKIRLAEENFVDWESLLIFMENYAEE